MFYQECCSLTGCVTHYPVIVSKVAIDNRPFPSLLEPLFQSESKCESFVMVISSAFLMNENSFSFQRLRT